MRHIVGYITDNKRINYQSIPSIYHFESVKDNKISQYPLLIIDFSEIEKGLECINKYREIDDSIPVIWLIKYEDYMNIHGFLKNVKGIGRVETLAVGGRNINRVDEKIEKILNPNLPVKREEIAFVIPVFNEENRFDHVRSFVKKIKSLNDTVLHNLSIYFINDGSSDNSLKLIEELIIEYKDVEDVVQMSSKFNIRNISVNTKKAGTYIQAFDIISSDIIIFADADDGYEFEDIMRMLNLLNQGYYDMIVGTKDLLSENRTSVRRFVSACKRILTKPLLPSGVTDSQTGLKVFKKAMLNYILPSLDTKYGLAIDLKILNSAKKNRLRVYEMPVNFIDRDGSHVEIVKDSIRFIKSILIILFSNKKGCIR